VLRPSNTATGNVFVDPAYPGLPHEVSIPPEPNDEAREALAAWAQTCSSGGATAFVQLNHGGRQSQAGAGTRSIFAKTIAPSPVPLDLGPGILPDIARRLLFGTPREMTFADIELAISQFAHSAAVVAEAGFDGVVLHGAHGYLLAQFLSRKTNLRRDEWGGDAERRVRIVVEVIKRVRETTPEGFALGIKLNSADHQNDQDMEETLTQVKAIVEAGVDFIEISGGSWEDPKVCIARLTPLPPHHHLEQLLGQMLTGRADDRRHPRAIGQDPGP
jgi:2,4-dienoyl-CoA reductase-like NADH-dependent reductase (Old Yellow Enzyme family)